MSNKRGKGLVFIGTDHGGFDLKEELVAYPDIASVVCERVNQENGLGIVICGTGIELLPGTTTHQSSLQNLKPRTGLT